MMAKKYCPGCGVLLQTENPQGPGYIPENKYKDALICQRCFKLTHYKKLVGTRVKEEDLFQAIRSATGKADLTLMVADFFDPEGSLALNWSDLIKEPVILLINKIDLLPPRTSQTEIKEWFGGLWQRRFSGLKLGEILAVSAKEGFNPQYILGNLKGKKVALTGAANVGKSSLLSRLLTVETGTKAGKKTGLSPTVSGFPGTTQGVTCWRAERDNIEFYDTPGLTPFSRVGDFLCPECAAHLLPEEKLQIKLWDISSGDAVLFGNLAVVWNISPSSRRIAFFSSENIPIHRTNQEKARELREKVPNWLRVTCQRENASLLVENDIREFEVKPGEDLFISGLGWAAVKNETARLRLAISNRVEAGVRPSLIGRRYPG